MTSNMIFRRSKVITIILFTVICVTKRQKYRSHSVLASRDGQKTYPAKWNITVICKRRYDPDASYIIAEFHIACDKTMRSHSANVIWSYYFLKLHTICDNEWLLYSECDIVIMSPLIHTEFIFVRSDIWTSHFFTFVEKSCMKPWKPLIILDIKI